MISSKACLIFVFLCRFSVQSANILALMGMSSYSHHIWNSALTHALAERGHNITILSVELPKNLKDIPKNAHYIHLEETLNHIYKRSSETVDFTDFIGVSILAGIPPYYEFGEMVCEGILKSKGFKTLLDYPDNFKFDLVLTDYTMGPTLLGFVHKFKNPPLIGLTAYLNPPHTADLVGGHYYPAYIPFQASDYIENMNFFQRIHNSIAVAFDTLYRRLIYTPTIDKMVRQYFPADMPQLREIQQRTVLALVNTHPSINYPEPLPPNVIEVGAMQIKDPKPLPQDLENFIKSSKKGAILFSLGTNMQYVFVGMERTQKILDAMEQCPDYNFLWKFDLDPKTVKIPKNVLVKTFFPQGDILGHPNIKAFVSHAGGLSTQETTWFGVPMIGIPLFVDQPRNLRKSVNDGVAEEVDFLTLTTESLRDTILKVVGDKKYAENMKARSARFRDRPMKPLDSAIWWVEYVLRNPKPDHLRSPTLALGYFSSNCLDILTILFICVVVLVFVTCKVFCLLCGLVKTSKSTNVSKEKKIK